MTTKQHWERIWAGRHADSVSWYQSHAEGSLQLVDACRIGPAAPVIDVGGGASTLVDDLLARGFSRLTVLDLSPSALAGARQRLGKQASRVQWLEADVTRVELPRAHFALWHDRAVFHFLIDVQARETYIRQVRHALQRGGHAIIATFAKDGPPQCSGLPVRRYSGNGLAAEFNDGFTLLDTRYETHVTPAGVGQPFVYCLMRRD